MNLALQFEVLHHAAFGYHTKKALPVVFVFLVLEAYGVAVAVERACKTTISSRRI